MNQHYLPPNCVRNCTNDLIEIKVKDVVVERLAAMITLGVIPPYLLGMRIAALSKTKSTIIEKVEDIRPIGILSVLWKTCEAAMKSMMMKYCRELLEVGPE
jgi:hypothetical protein